MGAFGDIMILISILLEIAVLFYVETKTWRTIYTPLNFLMLPYLAILIITIFITLPDNSFGFDPLYYPSILFWNVGLLLFAIPSVAMGAWIQKSGPSVPFSATIPGDKMPKILVWLTFLVCLLFLYKLRATLGSSAETLGSEDFGEEFSSKGIWAHLRQLLVTVQILLIFYLDRKHWWLIIPILLIVFYSFVYTVKGWIIIPIVAGISMRLYSGKTRLKPKLFLWLILIAAVVFFVTYSLSLVVAGDAEMGEQVTQYVFKHFFHYLTSGILGLSSDMMLGFPEHGNFQVLLAPFINLCKTLTGNKEYVDILNSLFLNTGFEWTNVRTMFGTMAINCNLIQFVCFTLVLSLVFYSLKLITMFRPSVFTFAIYFYECAFLAMGWFDFYFSLLPTIEGPVIILCMWFLVEAVKPEECKLSVV